MSYDNNNEGAIWKNDKKEKDTHPDFRGNATVEGVEYWISAWKRSEGSNPKAPALKFKFTQKEAAHNEGYSQAKQAISPPQDDSFDDDIPF